MENTKQAQALLEKMESASRQQLLFTKVLCVLCALAVICSVVVMVTVSKTASALMEIAEPVQTLAAQAETVLTDLGAVAEGLSQVDFTAMADQMDSLALESQAAIGEAMKKLDGIDIDTLNKAIQDLAKIVEPLAKVSKFFG